MCFDRERTPSAPKPPDPPKVIAPAPPAPPPAPPKPLQQTGSKPDLRIGSQKSTDSNRSRVNSGSLKSSLNISGNKGLNL